MTLVEKVLRLRWLRSHGRRCESYRLWLEIESEAPDASNRY